MGRPLIWFVVLVLAALTGGCGKGPDTTGPSQEPASAAEKVLPAEKEVPPTAEKVITNSVGMKLVLIPAGEFMMGSPEGEEGRLDNEKQHRVRITKPFYLGMYEVTVGDFRRFADDTKYKTEAEKDGKGSFGWNETKGELELDPKYTWRNPGFKQDDGHPVVNVSWNDAVAYCAWLSKKEGRTYRLPTEAEWEYACRAGTTTRFYHGNAPEGLAKVGNVADAVFKAKLPDWKWTIKASDGYVFTAPMGSFRPNAFGLYDMHGNAWEWCADWYGSDYYGKSPTDDPTGPTSRSYRVLRGGGLSIGPTGCRSAFRCLLAPDGRSFVLGFRLASVK